MFALDFENRADNFVADQVELKQVLMTINVQDEIQHNWYNRKQANYCSNCGEKKVEIKRRRIGFMWCSNCGSKPRTNF